MATFHHLVISNTLRLKIYITSTTNSVMCSLNRLLGITSQFIKQLKNLSPSTNKTPEWQFKGRNQWYTFKNTVTFFLSFTNAQCFFGHVKNGFECIFIMYIN